MPIPIQTPFFPRLDNSFQSSVSKVRRALSSPGHAFELNFGLLNILEIFRTLSLHNKVADHPTTDNSLGLPN